jgi:hypothetical protein
VWISSIPSTNDVVDWAGGSTVLGSIKGRGSSPDDVWTVWATPDGGAGAGNYEMIIDEANNGVSFIDKRYPSDVSIYDYKFVSDSNTYFFKYIAEAGKYARVNYNGDAYNNSL